MAEGLDPPEGEPGIWRSKEGRPDIWGSQGACKGDPEKPGRISAGSEGVGDGLRGQRTGQESAHFPRKQSHCCGWGADYTWGQGTEVVQGLARLRRGVHGFSRVWEPQSPLSWAAGGASGNLVPVDWEGTAKDAPSRGSVGQSGVDWALAQVEQVMLEQSHGASSQGGAVGGAGGQKLRSRAAHLASGSDP